MYKKLVIFDFDGTIFNSPINSKENMDKYEKAIGIPWMITKQMSRELTSKHGKFVGMRQGWFGRAETLEPPLVPNPAPTEWFIKHVCEAFFKSKANPEELTVIMTGRHGGLRTQVLRILDDGKLVKVQRKSSKDGGLFIENADADVQLIMLGDNGPSPKGVKPSETFPFKIWIIPQFLEIHPTIEEVEIWEDREEHIIKFKELDLDKKITVISV